jgi:hypothetical protein
VGTGLFVAAAVLFIAAVIVLIIALRKPRAPKQPKARTDPLAFNAMPEFGPRQLGPGAIVGYGGIDYLVRGTVTLSEGPFVWWEHLIEGDGAEPLWFSVEEDEGRLELAFWKARRDLVLQPGGPQTADGRTFHEQERGHANYTSEGTTGLAPAGAMDYVDYATDDGAALLSFERYGADMPWELSTGTPVRPGELTLYPAPPPAGA